MMEARTRKYKATASGKQIRFSNPFHSCLSLLMKEKGNRVYVKFFVVQIDKKATLLGQTLSWFSRIVVWIWESQVTDSTVLICSKSCVCHTDLAHEVNETNQTQIIPGVYVGWCLSLRCFKLWVFISFNMVSKGLQFKGETKLSICSYITLCTVYSISDGDPGACIILSIRLWHLYVYCWIGW